MQQLYNFISRYVDLNNQDKEVLASVVQVITVDKDEFLLKPGQVCSYMWFIEAGMIRKYYLNDGKEITTWIHCEQEMLTSLSSYFNQRPADEYIQAEVPTTLYRLSVSDREKLNAYPNIVLFGQRLMEEQMALIDDITRYLQNKSATERYNWLMAYAPHLIQRVKLGYLASILGMTQETLSRIRRDVL